MLQVKFTDTIQQLLASGKLKFANDHPDLENTYPPFDKDDQSNTPYRHTDNLPSAILYNELKANIYRIKQSSQTTGNPSENERI